MSVFVEGCDDKDAGLEIENKNIQFKLLVTIIIKIALIPWIFPVHLLSFYRGNFVRTVSIKAATPFGFLSVQLESEDDEMGEGGYEEGQEPLNASPLVSCLIIFLNFLILIFISLLQFFLSLFLLSLLVNFEANRNNCYDIQKFTEEDHILEYVSDVHVLILIFSGEPLEYLPWHDEVIGLVVVFHADLDLSGIAFLLRFALRLCIPSSM